MYYYNNNNDKEDPSGGINFDANQLFGQSFEDLNTMNDNNNPFLNFDSNSHSLPLHQFEDTNHLFQDYHHFDTDNNINPSNITLDFPQSILLSDPNFLRQQQLLQDQQQKANKIISEQQQHSQPIRSNLSAMFNTVEKNNVKEESLSPQIEPINLITSQQQKKDILNSQQNRKSISNSTVKSTKPIPISSSLPSSSGIDHQRRFNELQARFRINYAKKPTKQQSNDTMTSHSYNEQHPLSSSFTDTSITNNRRKSSLDINSKPLLRLNNSKIKVIGNNKSPTSNISIPAPTKEEMTPPTVAASSFPSRTMPIQIQRVHRVNSFQPFDLEQRQKRLDDQLIKVDFNDITVSELKEMLRQRGKPATGKKAILLQRLQEEKDLINHARANGIPISNRYAIIQPIVENNSSPVMNSPIMDHAASLPDNNNFLSSSPNTTNTGIGSLNRSIADMHIGSPPITSQQSRRFAPYATSPRSNTSQHYSSSVPTGSLDMMMMQQQQQQQQQQQVDEPRVMRGFNFNKKSYAPFASSALATPDRDDDHNPFDQVDKSTNSNDFDSPNDMEWTDPTLDLMLQQHGIGIGSQYNEKSTEELLSFLSSQGLYPNDGIENNFQNLNGGPDPSSIMFDGYLDNNNNNKHH